MSSLQEDIVRNFVTTTTFPLVLRGFVSNWSLCNWTLDNWKATFGEKKIPFRCMNKDFISDEPCWERHCKVKSLTLKEFINTIPISEEWMYFDYKYMQQWFVPEDDIYKAISWKQFGFADKGPKDTTLWIGSRAAHTPAHQDTYGVNIVAQIYGKKRWILFPPETGNMKPTRVPYEESSVYSELNFYCPANLEDFKCLNGCRMVELSTGDALILPRGWWHYVQNIDPINIAVNVWLPHENDKSTQVSEALIKLFVAQVCKDLPQDTAKLVLNPNEDDIADTPLAVLFLQLETVSKSYVENKRKVRRVKRQRTCEDDAEHATKDNIIDLKPHLENSANNIQVVPVISNEDLIGLIEGNMKQFTNATRPRREDEVDGSLTNLRLTKAVIDSFTQPNVIDLIKQNLFTRLN